MWFDLWTAVRLRPSSRKKSSSLFKQDLEQDFRNYHSLMLDASQMGKVVALVAGKVPGHLQSTVEAPLSEILNPQMFGEPAWGRLAHVHVCVFICVFFFTLNPPAPYNPAEQLGLRPAKLMGSCSETERWCCRSCVTSSSGFLQDGKGERRVKAWGPPNLFLLAQSCLFPQKNKTKHICTWYRPKRLEILGSVLLLRVCS